jgi:hypothetical protein
MATRQTHEQGRGNKDRGAQAARTTGERARDAEGRFIDEDDESTGMCSTSGRNDSDSQARDRDEQGRFTDDDGTTRSRSASDRDDEDQPRDAQGRFTDDDTAGNSRSMSGQDGKRSASTRSDTKTSGGKSRH